MLERSLKSTLWTLDSDFASLDFDGDYQTKNYIQIEFNVKRLKNEILPPSGTVTERVV